MSMRKVSRVLFPSDVKFLLIEKPREVSFLRLFYLLDFYATVSQNVTFPFSLSNVSERVSQSQFHSEISIINASSFRNSENSFTIFFISSLSD